MISLKYRIASLSTPNTRGYLHDSTREALSILCSSERSTCYKHTLQLQLQEAEQEC